MKTYSKSNYWVYYSTCVKASFLINLPATFLKKRLFLCKFGDTFKKTFFTEQLQVAGSDIWMQVVYNFVVYNFIFAICNAKLHISLLRVFTLAHASVSPEFLHRFVFRQGYF